MRPFARAPLGLALLTLSACASPAPSTESRAPKLAASVPPPPSVPAPLYASLFEAPRVFKLRVVSTSSQLDGDTDRFVTKKTTTSATCRVTEVAARPWGVVSTITCEGLDASGAPDALSGTWAATTAGLFHFSDLDPREPREPESFTDDDLVLTASPSPSDVDHTDPTNPAFGRRRTVTRDEGGWCSAPDSSSGDESWSSICFDASGGVRSGTWGWAGGSTHAHELVVVR